MQKQHSKGSQRSDNVTAIRAVQAKAAARASPKADTSPLTRSRVERLGGRQSPRRLWLEFWALLDEERVGGGGFMLPDDANHYVWTGELDDEGRPVFYAGGLALLARHVVWAYSGRRLAAGKTLEPKCGRDTCLRPEHQRIVKAVGVTKRDVSSRDVTCRNETSRAAARAELRRAVP